MSGAATPAVRVAPRVRRLRAPNPSLMTGEGTNTYLVGTEVVTVVDPGPDVDEHVERLVGEARGRARYVVVTHTHPDHAPAARRVASLTGATVLGFDSRDGFEPDGLLADGDLVVGDGYRLQALHTPGHASNHLCYLLEYTSPAGAAGGDGEDPRTRLLFSGDHVMGGVTPVIAPPDGDMQAYLASLERLLALDPPLTGILPGHGEPLADPSALLASYLDHRRAREQAILDALRRRGAAHIDELVADVYTDVAPVLHPLARYTVWAHLRKLAAEGLARLSEGAGSDEGELTARWRAVLRA